MPLIPSTIADEVLESVGLAEISSSHKSLQRRDDPIFPIMENSGADLSSLITKMVHLMNTAKNTGTQAKCAMRLLEIHGYPGAREDDHSSKINIVINNGDNRVAQIFNPKREGI